MINRMPKKDTGKWKLDRKRKKERTHFLPSGEVYSFHTVDASAFCCNDNNN